MGLGFIPLQQVNVAPGVVSDSGQDFQPVREFYHIVIGTERKRLGLGHGLFLAGKNDQRHLPGCRVCAIIPDQGQAVDFGHYQILQDDRWLDSVCGLDGLGGILAIVKIDIMFGRQHTTKGFADHVLIIHQQNGYSVLG